MPLICLHYSRLYEDKLRKKEMNGGVLKGEWKVPLGIEVFIYVSEADSVEEGKIDYKIGIAKIFSCEVKKVKELSEIEAKMECCRNRQELIDTIKYWHKVEDEDFVTFLRFELKVL